MPPHLVILSNSEPKKNMTLPGLLIEFNLPLSEFLSKIMFKGPSEFLVLKFNAEINKNQILLLYIPGIFYAFSFNSCPLDAKNAMHWADAETKSKKVRDDMERWSILLLACIALMRVMRERVSKFLL